MDEKSIISKFDHFVATGVILFDHAQETIEYSDGDLKFQFILTTALVKKPTIHRAQQGNDKSTESTDDRRLGSDISTRGFELGDVGSNHFLVANKFCFARPHVLLLTSNGYERQFKALNGTDLDAAWSLLRDLGSDYVVFYNCGRDGGCSRLHKHLQLMPMPQNSFAAFLDDSQGEEPEIPFQWFYHRFEPREATSIGIFKVYRNLLEQATAVSGACSEHAASEPVEADCPHNMILTERWIIVIPRWRAAVNQKAAANAIGMLGVIAVATKDEMNDWIRLGPRNCIKNLGVPRTY